VPRGGDAPQPRVDGGRHAAELTLAGEQLPERVADVDDPDVGRIDAGGLDRSGDHRLDEFGETVAGPAPVGGEIGLETAGNPGGRSSHAGTSVQASLL
jgi:hypothetical protein